MNNQQTDDAETRRQAIQSRLNYLRVINVKLNRQTNFHEKLSFINSQLDLLSETQHSFLKLRERLFVYRDEIKDDLEKLKQQLPAIYSQSESIINGSRNLLLRQIDDLHKNVMQVALRSGDPLELELPVQVLEQELERVRRELNSIGATIDGLVSKVADRLVDNRNLIGYLHWCIDQFIALNYAFEKGENIVAFKEAHYLVKNNGKEAKIPGVLYVTDRRIIFERREKIVTKRKWGLFASETQDVTEILLKESASAIENMTNEVSGLIFKDFILKLSQHQRSEPLIFYVATDEFPKWFYFQMSSLISGTLNRMT